MTTVYSVSGIGEDGEEFFPTKAAAIKAANASDEPAEVREVVIASGYGAREFACLLLNHRGFAASQKVVHQNRAQREWAGTETGSRMIDQLSNPKG